MKKKITLSTAVTLIILTVALTVSVTMLVAIRYFNRQVQSVSKRQAMYTHINDVDQKVREYYSELDEEALRQGITQGYINGVHDSYAAYFTPEGYTLEQLRLSGRVNDVGVGVCSNAAGDLVVCRVDTDSAADRAGVKVGNLVKAVDSETVAGRDAAAVQAKLDSTERVLLSVSQNNVAVAFELSAYQHTVRSVQETLLGSVGYIKITAFYENTPDQFKAVMASLIEKGATSLVFDLRNNAGGLREAAEAVISHLLPLGQYGVETSASGIVTTLSSTSSNQTGLPSATLINQATSGEAEFFAGVLQEFSLTTVVGETSAGKAKYQDYFSLEADNSAVKLTIGEYSLLKGGSWEGKGIQPTLEVSLTTAQQAIAPLLTVEEDPQIQAALTQIGGVSSANAAKNAAK